MAEQFKPKFPAFKYSPDLSGKNLHGGHLFRTAEEFQKACDENPTAKWYDNPQHKEEVKPVSNEEQMRNLAQENVDLKDQLAVANQVIENLKSQLSGTGSVGEESEDSPSMPSVRKGKARG